MWQTMNRRPILVISTPVVFASGVQAAGKLRSVWITVFVPTARAFLGGGDIYGVNGYA
jgi:hypothetical protein